MRLTFGFQNLTEATPAQATLGCDIQHYCEVDPRRLKAAAKARGLKVWIPRRDRHQAVVWDPKTVKPVFGSKRYTQFHRSGKAEGWSIATPARGMLRVTWKAPRRNHKGFKKFKTKSAWLLNSWGKPDEKRRREIVEKTTMPVIHRDVTADAASLIPQGLFGDFNNVRWDGDLPNLRQVHRSGLDRAWLSEEFHDTSVTEGPKVGVGNDMQHHSLVVVTHL